MTTITTVPSLAKTWTIGDWAFEVEAALGSTVFMVEGLNNVLLNEGLIYRFNFTDNHQKVTCKEIGLEDIPSEFRATVINQQLRL